MISRVPPRFIELIRERVDLGELVAEHGIDLRGAGTGRYVGLCPFHAEKSPSLTVYDDAHSHFHCFGCGAHGDVFGFVMRARGIPFSDALAELAHRAGVSLIAGSRFRALGPTPHQRAAAARREVFEELRRLWVLRAKITNDAAGSPVLEAHVLEHELPELAEREIRLIVRFYELTIVTHRKARADARSAA